jgi:hypothetical protein
LTILKNFVSNDHFVSIVI